jgi:hypothetical protein
VISQLRLVLRSRKVELHLSLKSIHGLVVKSLSILRVLRLYTFQIQDLYKILLSFLIII